MADESIEISAEDPAEGKANGRPADGGYTDSYIEKDDQDRFNFQDYAGVLADSVHAAGTPLTIGVFGRWGSGKSSLMKLLEGRMKRGQEGKVETLWINVWELSTQDEVWHAFLQALFSEVHRRLRWWRRINSLKLVTQVFSLLWRVVLVFTPIVLGLLFAGSGDADPDEVTTLIFASGGTTVGILLWTLTQLKPIIEAVKGVATFDLKEVLKDAPYEAQITELMRLKKQFKDMVDLWVGKEGRLLVFVDDLDRCTPDQVPEVLEAIKLFTTTPGCVYVLGLDHDIVRQGLKKKYEFETETAAAEYLEKVVQIPFHLPPLDKARVENFIEQSYSTLHQEHPMAARIFSEGLEPNPRKIKRALNIYRTLLALAEGRVRAWEMDPVNEELVAKMVVIQSRFRELHEYLTRNPTFLLEVEEKALADSPDDASFKGDDEVGRRLLGTKDEPGLIDENGLGPLQAMLRIGNKYFNEDDERNQISTYIYLTSTAEGSATGVRPNRREREALLGGNLEQIKQTVDDILTRGQDDKAQQAITEAYIERLEAVMSAPDGQYTAAERDAASLALNLLSPKPETVLVPAGPFLMGSADDDEQARDDEKPQHTLELADYAIGKYPVTNLEYQAFVLGAGHQPLKNWEGGRYPQGKGDHPVVNVSWHDAVAYCHWLGDKSGQSYRLPSEAEWEKAARSTDGRIYAWGNDWDPAKLNSFETGPGDTTPVGHYSPRGDSPYGAADMCGNVWEWCSTIYTDKAYPFQVEDEWQADYVDRTEVLRVVRGGSFNLNWRYARCAVRNGLDPYYRLINPGFRIVVAPISPSAL